jgi:hypothetical protein
MASTVEINLPLPVLPEGWAGEKDFKSIGQLSEATDRTIEPVGPHFLAYARRVRHMPGDIARQQLMTLFCVEAQQAHFLRG